MTLSEKLAGMIGVAERATGSPWRVRCPRHDSINGAHIIGGEDTIIARITQKADKAIYQKEADAIHIAQFHPAISIALAEVALAAQECAAPFKFAEGAIGSGKISIDHEGIAREFSRRQQVAAKALATLAAALGEDDG